MTAEQLVNWILCAAGYVHATDDRGWLRRRAALVAGCHVSLANRCRGGVVAADSSRVQGGAEITTYDSLDASLGQARQNVYLAGKTWAAWVLLEALQQTLGDGAAAAQAADQARRAAATIVAAGDATGRLPALLGEPSAAFVIPAIEGLVFPHLFGRAAAVAADGPFAGLIHALRRHLAAVLRPGVCLFPDGGWKLSSTSDNSWLSKIYLCQYIARNVLAVPVDPRADAAHARWLQNPDNLYWAWSDQMHAGIAKGSRYYPRGVTAVLWLRA